MDEETVAPPLGRAVTKRTARSHQVSDVDRDPGRQADRGELERHGRGRVLGPAVHQPDGDLVFGRVVVSELGAPNIFFRGTDSAMKWMSGNAKRQCDRAIR
jgi:hypothetical protein